VRTKQTAALARRLEARHRALDQSLTALAHDRRTAAETARAGTWAAYGRLRTAQRLSSFDCMAFDEFARALHARAAAFEASAQALRAAADRARDERRRWGAISVGLERRLLRVRSSKPCRD
jgi:hypothetical protein